MFLFFFCVCHLRSDKGARVHAVNTQRNNHSLFCGSNTPRTRWPHTLYAATLFMFHLIIIRANTAVRIRFTSLISVAKHEKKNTSRDKDFNYTPTDRNPCSYATPTSSTRPPLPPPPQPPPSLSLLFCLIPLRFFLSPNPKLLSSPILYVYICHSFVGEQVCRKRSYGNK